MISLVCTRVHTAGYSNRIQRTSAVTKMRVVTKLVSSIAERAVVYRAASLISHFPNRTISSPLYTPTPFQLSTQASKYATDHSLLHPPTTKSHNHHQTQNILHLSHDEDPDDDIDVWKVEESTILREIRPIRRFVKYILHSNRYKDGELLTLEDEKKLVEKLLPYHPHIEEKKGCGFDSIMVGRHPEFESSRCLFIIQKNGYYTDISYRKCLEGLIRKKYPSFAEKFISIHFRGNS